MFKVIHFLIVKISNNNREKKAGLLSSSKYRFVDVSKSNPIEKEEFL